MYIYIYITYFHFMFENCAINETFISCPHYYPNFQSRAIPTPHKLKGDLYIWGVSKHWWHATFCIFGADVTYPQLLLKKEGQGSRKDVSTIETPYTRRASQKPTCRKAGRRRQEGRRWKGLRIG